MTEPNLSTLIHAHATSGEPPFPPPDRVLTAGHRRLRIQRLAASIGGAAVLTAVTAGVAALPSATEPSRPSAIEPATQPAHEDYDAQLMPKVLDQAAREVLGRSVPDLGEGDFTARAATGGKLKPESYDEASWMGIEYGSRARGKLWGLSLYHAKGEVEGDHERVCVEELEEGYQLVCRVESLANGIVLIEKLMAMRSASSASGGWYGVRRDQLNDVEPDRLWFQHTVEVVKSETFGASVSEVVKAPSQEAAEQQLLVPAADLAELASDPNMVIPEPAS